MMFGLPWWVYMMIGFIFLSGYMAFRAIRAEKQLEQQYIEREGTVFMERIAHEKQLKHLEEEDDRSANGEYAEHMGEFDETVSESLASNLTAPENTDVQNTDAERKRHVSV